MSFTNFIAVDGNVVRDADIKYTNNGACVLSFTVAHNTKIGDKEEVYYFDCAVMGKYAEMLAGSLVKGLSVLVIGKLQQRRWEADGVKKQKVQIFATQVMANASKKEATGGPKQAPPPEQDDIPF